MAWVTIGDSYGKCEVTFFPDSFMDHEDILRSGHVLVFELKKNIYKGNVSAVCNKCMLLSEYRMMHTVAIHTKESINSKHSKGVPIYEMGQSNGKKAPMRRIDLDEIFNT